MQRSCPCDNWPCGPMDKALAYGARDSGFDPQHGRNLPFWERRHHFDVWMWDQWALLFADCKFVRRITFGLATWLSELHHFGAHSYFDVGMWGQLALLSPDCKIVRSITFGLATWFSELDRTRYRFVILTKLKTINYVHSNYLVDQSPTILYIEDRGCKLLKQESLWTEDQLRVNYLVDKSPAI